MEVEKKSRLLEGILIGIELQIKQPGADVPELTKKKLAILQEMKQYESILNVGLCFIGSQGPDCIVFKQIVAALCYSSKYQECLNILERWAKIYPDQQTNLQEMQQIVEPLVKRFISNTSCSIFPNIDHLLGLPKLKLGAQNGASENGGWRFRPPPRQGATYYICPRITEIAPCMFGDNCLAAHSKEELQEWKARAKAVSQRKNGIMSVVLGISPTEAQPPSHFGDARGPRFNAIPGAYSPRLPEPPPNTAYLNQLIENYFEHTDLFCPLVEGVKLTWSSPLQLRTTQLEYVWIVLIRSERKDTLRTVSLLHNVYRGHFRISEAYFCEDSSYRQCMDLIESNICNHKNASKLQVLSTFIPPKCLNRHCYYYRIGFTFRATVPGNFIQTIVFDFKENPKLIQELKLQVLPSEAIPPNGSVRVPTTPAIAQNKSPNNTQRQRLPNSETENTAGTLGARAANIEATPAHALELTTIAGTESSATNNHYSTFMLTKSGNKFPPYAGNILQPGISPTYNGAKGGAIAAGAGSDRRQKYAPTSQKLYKKVPGLELTTNRFQPLSHSGAIGINSGRGQRGSSFSSSASDSDSPVSFEETLHRPIPPPISRPKPKHVAPLPSLGGVPPPNSARADAHSFINGLGRRLPLDRIHVPLGLNQNLPPYGTEESNKFLDELIQGLTTRFGHA